MDVSFILSVVTLDSFTTATCTVSGAVAQIQSFRWEKDGNSIVANDRITITVGTSSSMLEIEQANLDDAGEYSCNVLFVGGGSIAGSDSLQVASKLEREREREGR